MAHAGVHGSSTIVVATCLNGCMHIVIVGCGRVGSGLARALEAEGHSVAIIDKAKKAFRRLPADFKGVVVEGSGFDRDSLAEARIEGADAFAAVTSGDNSNILAARIARETFGVERVVARIYDPQRAQVYQRLGIPTVATVTWTVDQVRRWLLPDSCTPQWRDASGTLMLIDRVLPDRLAGQKLATLEVPGKIRLVAVTRAGVPRLDAQSLVGQDGDLLHIAVAKHDLEILDGLLAPVAVAAKASA
jgi:trk system potassium uptake protein TrkA